MKATQLNVLVNGIGNIGTTVLNVLVQFKKQLGINKIYALKNILKAWNHTDLEKLSKQGVIICTINSTSDYCLVSNIIDEVAYIFDCTANGIGLKNKKWYENLPNLIGCCAQGSEKGFGLPFMTGLNSEKIRESKFAQIVSCNTHSLAAILTTFTNLSPYNNEKSAMQYPNLVDADFVIVRRSEDLGQHERLVSAHVVSRHLDPIWGTHHAIDVNDLLKTIGKKLKISSSDITTPSQLMHGVRFHLQFDSALPANPETLVKLSPFVSGTHKFDSNVIFEQGRRYSFLGRLYSHAIVVDNNFLQTERSLKGWAFIPQEGCTIISTIDAFLQQSKHPNAETVLQEVSKLLISKRW